MNSIVRYSISAVGLIATGTTAHAQDNITSRLDASFWSVGLGGAELHAPTGHRSAFSGQLSIGKRIASRLQLTGDLQLLSGDEKTNVTGASSEQRYSSAIGVRWTPFDGHPVTGRTAVSLIGPVPRYDDPSAVYFRVGVGYAQSHTESFGAITGSSVDGGPLGLAAVGWAPMQGADYAFGLELRVNTFRVAGAEQSDVSLLLVAQLY